MGYLTRFRTNQRLCQVQTPCLSQTSTAAFANRVSITSEAVNGTLFDTYKGEWIQQIKSTQSIQLFSHEHGVSPATYNSTPALDSFYQILATSRDLNDTEFIALIEARDYPIYGNQYHPEKNIFEWITTSPIPHNATAVAMSTYYANYFVAEARRNSLTFGGEAILKPYLIYNYEPYFLDGYFTQI